MLSTTTLVVRAQDITADTTDATIVGLFVTALRRKDMASHAKAMVVYYASEARSQKDVAALLAVSGAAISRYCRDARNFLALGISDASDARTPWSVAQGLRTYWDTDAGKSDAARIAALPTDEERVTALVAIVRDDVAERATVTPEDALLALLARAVDLASGDLTLTAEHRAVIGDALATIASATGATVAPLVNA